MSNNYITCQFAGRLANCIFQTAALIAYSKKHGIPYYIPANYPHKEIYRFKNLTTREYAKLPRWEQPSFRHHEIPKFNQPTELIGYFQSWKYMHEYRQDIIDTFEFKQTDESGFVALHVRRGDYLKYPTRFPVVTMDYISKAVEFFRGHGYTSFMVFSDDIKWCMENFKDIYGAFMYVEPGDPVEDLMRMSCCDHQIIANSSYSYIAAYFNRNPGKIVVAPNAEKNWFGTDGKLPVQDLLPSGWHQIEY